MDLQVLDHKLLSERPQYLDLVGNNTAGQSALHCLEEIKLWITQGILFQNFIRL